LSDVRAERILLVAQAKKDAEDIRAGRKMLRFDDRGQLFLSSLDAAFTPRLPNFSNEPAVGQDESQASFSDPVLSSAVREIERNVNLNQIALYAEEQGQKISDEEVSDKEIDSDWIHKWRENAQDITDEHMRRLWGRILADEAKAPGSYRMRTLDFLRTLDKQDALKIAALGPYVLDLSWIHRQDETFVGGKGPSYDDLLELQDMGIVAGLGLDLQRRFSAKPGAEKFSNTHSCGGKALAFERKNPEPPYQLYYYRLTSLGREVLRLGDYAGNEEYLKQLGLELKNRGFRVRYGTWIRKPGADSTWGRLSPDAVDL
jgi:hypothetical protein